MDFSNVGYEKVASILRQCEWRGQHGGKILPGNPKKLNGNHCGGHSCGRGFGGHCSRGQSRYSADNLRQAKCTKPCTKCEKHAHWCRDHNQDGSIKPGVVISDKPLMRNTANALPQAVHIMPTITANLVRALSPMYQKPGQAIKMQALMRRSLIDLRLHSFRLALSLPDLHVCQPNDLTRLAS